MYKERPRIKIELTKTDRVLNTVTLLALVALAVYPALHFSALPSTIPIHLNISGEIDNYGSKHLIWFLPILGMFIYFGISALLKRPHIYNYGVKVTDNNALSLYRAGVRLMRIVRLWVVLIILLVVIEFVSLAKGNDSSAKWLLPVILISALGLVIYSVSQSFRKNQAHNN